MRNRIVGVMDVEQLAEFPMLEGASEPQVVTSLYPEAKDELIANVHQLAVDLMIEYARYRQREGVHAA